MSKSHKPGEKAPCSGQYERIGPRGGKSGEEITAVEKKPFPPTRRPGEKYILVDPTKHSPKKK